MNIQSNKRIQNILWILFCYSLEIMSHNSVYYLRKLSKKLPPGCSKLENFGFGKQVIHESSLIQGKMRFKNVILQTGPTDVTNTLTPESE